MADGNEMGIILPQIWPAIVKLTVGFAETLLSWLKREFGRSRKRRRNLKQLDRDLAALGHDKPVPFSNFQ